MDMKTRTFTGSSARTGNGHDLLLIALRPRTIKCVRSVAEHLGFAFSAVEDLDHFRTHLTVGDPGLIVLDLNIPASFGVAAIRQMQSRNTPASLVLISGLSDPFLKSTERMIVDSGLRLQTVLRSPLDTITLERELSRAHQELMFNAGDLAQALAKDQIRVHYQPVMELHSRNGWRVDSFEALARWQHPVLGLIQPGYFIPLAENSGFGLDLSRHIVDLALAEFAPVLGRRAAISLSFNMSPQLFHTDAWVNELVHLARKHDVNPARITLELSEYGLSDPDVVDNAVGALREQGFRFSIDDFGVGDSSLVRYSRMQFSELKIHGSLIREVNESDEARIILELMIDLSRRLDIRVCAEGVENRSNVEMLRDMGCNRAQGFYFGEPLPLERIGMRLKGASTDPDPGNGASRV